VLAGERIAVCTPRSTIQPLQQRKTDGEAGMVRVKVMLPTARVQEYIDFIAANAH
jgi:hypothetical protein